MIAIEHVSANRLLARLAPADLALLSPHLEVHFLERGKVLQEPESPIRQVWFPLSGMVSLVVVKPDGSLVETGVVGREGAVNGLVGAGPWKAFSKAIMQLPGEAVVIDMTRFQEAARHSDDLRNIILRHREFLLDQIQQTAACNALHALEPRLARWLLEGHDRAQEPMISLTHEFLSEMLGVRRTSVTTTAEKLQSLGLIQKHRAGILILDRPRLEAAACDCYSTLRQHHAEIFQERNTTIVTNVH
jgi:CRP-like cAMP-binding protein